MRKGQSRVALSILFGFFVLGLLTFLLPPNGAAETQPVTMLDGGTAINVRTVETIWVTRSDGRVFSGITEQPVRDQRGTTLLPRNADVELVVKMVGEGEYALDLESITTNGRRMGVRTDPTAEDKERSSIVAAVRGAIIDSGIGPVPDGSGIVMRVGAQVATKGKAVKIPAGSLVTFRLEKPLHAGVADAGFSRNGKHFHRGFGIEEVNTRPYEAGLQSGRLDRQNRRLFDRRSNVWSGAELFEYHAGYQRGFEETPGPIPAGNSIRIGADHYIRWSGPPDSRVFVKVDGQKRLFSTENSGAHPAPWMRPGRKYVFTLVDQNGKELAKDENDLTISRGNTMD